MFKYIRISYVELSRLVFTLPQDLNAWVQLHPALIYRLLFKVVWATLKAFGADPKRLGGQLGVTAILHTWYGALPRIQFSCARIS